jgi:hypothetical protein
LVSHSRKAAMVAVSKQQKELTMTENTTTTNTTGKKKPDFVAFNVRPRNDKKSRWTEIGVAFRHKDGNGLDILIDAVPLSGKIVLRLPAESNS